MHITANRCLLTGLLLTGLLLTSLLLTIELLTGLLRPNHKDFRGFTSPVKRHVNLQYLPKIKLFVTLNNQLVTLNIYADFS